MPRRGLVLAVPVALAALTVAANAQSGLVAPPPLPAPAPLSIVPPPLPQIQYFYNDNGKPAGPVALPEMAAKVGSGAIKSDTLVWQSGTPNWVAAKDLPAIAALLAVAPTGGNRSPGAPVAGALDVATYFLGTWVSEEEGPAGTVGPAKLTTTLLRGGSLTGTYTMTLAGSGISRSYPVSGSWRAVKIDEKRANLAFDLVVLADGQQRPLATSSLLEIVDQNTVRDAFDGSVTKRVGP